MDSLPAAAIGNGISNLLCDGCNHAIEVVQTCDLLPATDFEAYAELTRQVVAALLRAPGIVEIRANRNLLGSPQVRATIEWQSLADWARQRKSASWLRWSLNRAGACPMCASRSEAHRSFCPNRPRQQSRERPRCLPMMAWIDVALDDHVVLDGRVAADPPTWAGRVAAPHCCGAAP
ncbi:hypothetical protein BN2476_110096 [Paraburkholderia piptadeniae]|uniref:ABM domain-containing protein n=1 Tax=Paraburkholderia piptadeniae TaxID=1701573 RepID=A0A1N7RPR6_9BURK|nr:antibiotic biosynthesis monooxygenase [Paraburkholderia piptadeniae]SIT37093.1 hypothetical protein BN2476_110096 [Paraburkholderia piptadeniae]